MNAVVSDAATSHDSDLRNIVLCGTPLTATSLAVAERTGAKGLEMLAATGRWKAVSQRSEICEQQAMSRSWSKSCIEGVSMAASSDHPSESALSQGITRSLARYVVATQFEELPAAVRREALRSLLNWMGVAVGGSRHETIEIALAAI